MTKDLRAAVEGLVEEFAIYMKGSVSPESWDIAVLRLRAVLDATAEPPCDAPEFHPAMFRCLPAHSTKADPLGVFGNLPINHGTDAGYRAHFRDNSPACAPCKAAHSKATSDSKRKRTA